MDNLIRVAVVDDHPLFRSGVAEVVNSNPNMNVEIQPANGKELIDLLHGKPDLPTVCLLDITMPVMNGYETLQYLQETWPQIKVLVLSVHDHEYAIVSTLKKGASGYILKGCNPKEIGAAINAVCNVGFYHSELTQSHLTKLVTGKDTLNLNSREQEFLRWCCSDLNYREIANKMLVSERTVEGYREMLFQKLRVKSRTGLVMFSIQTGIYP